MAASTTKVTKLEGAFGTTNNVLTLMWELGNAGGSYGTGDAAGPQHIADFSDICVQISGTFSTGTVAIQGSMDGVNWFTLSNTAGTALSGISSAGLKQILESVLYLRPVVSSGDGTTDLTIIAKCRRSNMQRT